MTALTGTERLSGDKYALRTVKQKVNQEQIVQDFRVDSAQGTLFREVSRATRPQRGASATRNVVVVVVLCVVYILIISIFIPKSVFTKDNYFQYGHDSLVG